MGTSVSGHAPMDVLLSHAGFVRGLARALVAGDDDAEDLVQETWLAALTSKQGPPRKPRAWLASIVRRRAARQYRARARLADRHSKAVRPNAVASTADLALRHEQIQSVSRAIEAIPTHYRDALVLRFYDGLPPREVASRLGVPVETARTRIRRGLERMRTELDAQKAGNRAAWAAPLAEFLNSGQVAGAGASVTALGALAVGLVLLAGGVIVATLSSSNAPQRLRDVDTDTTRPPILVGRGDPGSAAPTQTYEPERGADSRVPSNRIRIRGRLSTADGMHPRDPAVYVTWHTHPAREVVGPPIPVGADGRFDVVVPYAPWPVEREVDPAPSMLLRVVATADGYGTTAQSVTAHQGEERTVELVLRRGTKLEGRIVDRGGRPVAGLALVASTRRMGSRKVVSQQTFEPDVELPLAHQLDTARATTDADGRFVLRGLAKGPYWLYSASPDWFLPLEDVLCVDAEPTSHVAIRPFALVGEVRDARTSRPVDARIWLRVRPEAGPGVSSPIGTGSVVQAAWLLSDLDFAGAMEVTVSAQARGYLPFEQTIRYEPNERSKQLDVLLQPTGRGTLIVRVLKADGSVCTDKVQVDLRRPGAGMATDMTAPRTADRVSPIRIQAPATRWVLHVFPLQSAFSDLTGWTGEVDVLADREEHVDVRLPPYGSLRIRAIGSKPTEMTSFVVDLNRGSENPTMGFSGPQVELAWPAGTFRIRHEDAQGTVTQTIVVREDERTDVQLTR